MMKATLAELKSHLPKYINLAMSGEKVMICKGRNVLAVIGPAENKKKNIWGLGKGKVSLKKSFFDPLTEEDFPGVGL